MAYRLIIGRSSRRNSIFCLARKNCLPSMGKAQQFSLVECFVLVVSRSLPPSHRKREAAAAFNRDYVSQIHPGKKMGFSVRVLCESVATNWK